MFWTAFKMAPWSMIIYPVLFLIAWLITLLSWLLSPIIALWSVIFRDPFPALWAWFYTHDNTLDGGWDERLDDYRDPQTLSWHSLAWQRMKWICRNPAYGFKAYVLGFKGVGEQDLVWSTGVAYPPSRFWYVVKDPQTERLYFGYRGKRTWLGWNYLAYGGYHQLKVKPFVFKE